MLNKEPAVILGALAEVVKAVIPMLIIFGLLKWTPEQVAQAMIVTSVVVGSLTVVLTRSQSYSADSAKTLLNMPQGADMKLADRAIAADVAVFPTDTKADVAKRVEVAEKAA